MLPIRRKQSVVAEVSEQDDGEEPNPHLNQAHDFSKYLKANRKEGPSSRVEKILKFFKWKPEAAALNFTDQELWQIEKREFQDKIDLLEKEIKKLREEGIVEQVFVEVGRPAMNDGAELELLRKENVLLRRKPGSKTDAKLVQTLRGEIEDLQALNTSLRSQLLMQRDQVLTVRPPKDVDFSGLARIPLEIPKIDRDRVFQVLENEWNEARENSRRGSANALKNPFERRRFHAPNFPVYN